MKKNRAILCCCFQLAIGALWSQNGNLDFNFGQNGKVITSFAPGDAFAWAMILQPDGKLLAGGKFDPPGGTNDEDCALVRYQTTGALDSTFGDNGKVILSISNQSDRVNALCLQSDGKIVVLVRSVEPSNQAVLFRLTPEGALDETFGTNGLTLTSYGDYVHGEALAVDAADRLILIGGTYFDIAFNFFLARYDADGMPDNSFGTNGVVVGDFGIWPSDAKGVAIQTDGKIVMLGTMFNAQGRDLVAWRFNTDGSPDLGFGNGGLSVVNAGTKETVPAVALQPDGSIAIVGPSDQSEGFTLFRLSPGGALDPAFGTGGAVTTNIGLVDIATSLAVRDDGRIRVGGFSWGSGGYWKFTLAAYTASGALDNSFGSGGIVSTDINFDDAIAHALVLQPDGKIVLAGVSIYGGYQVFTLARYLDENNVSVFKPAETPGFLLYPNPVFDQLTLDAPAGSIATIYTQTGQWVREWTILSGQKTYSIEDLPPGEYVLRLEIKGKGVSSAVFIVH